jgi:hypothetical protein
MAQWHLPQEMVLWITAMSATLDESLATTALSSNQP